MPSQGEASQTSSARDRTAPSSSVASNISALQSTVSKSRSPSSRTASNSSSCDSNDVTSGSSRMESLSRRMRLLALRKPKSSTTLSKRRWQNLQQMKEKEKEAILMAARLDSRLEIINLFMQRTLMDDSFLGRKELNPWLFKNNDSMHNKWDFVHNVVTTQEMLVAIDNAKKRQRAEMEMEKRRKEELQMKRKEEADELNEKKKQVEVKHKEMKEESNPLEIDHPAPLQEIEDISEESESLTDSREHPDDAISKDDGSDLSKPVTSTSSVATPTSSKVVPKPRFRSSPRLKYKTTRAFRVRAAKLRDGHQHTYAFGSTHDKERCQYCNSGLRVWVDPQKTNQPRSHQKTGDVVLKDRLEDIKGIYVSETARKTMGEKMQQRIDQVEALMKDRVVTFNHCQPSKSDSVS